MRRASIFVHVEAACPLPTQRPHSRLATQTCSPDHDGVGVQMRPSLTNLRLRAVSSTPLPATYNQRTRRSVSSRVGLNIDAIPVEALIAGGTTVAGALGVALWQMTQASVTTPDVQPAPEEPEPPVLPRQDAVLVFGATGRVGRRVIQKLVMSGKTVVAAVRSADKAREVFQPYGLKEGMQQDSAGLLFIESGVDVTRPECLDNPQLWQGVTQVVSLLGPAVGPQPDGSFGYLDNMTPERVEAGGWSNLKSILHKHLQLQQREVKEVLSMRTAEDLSAWERLDDVIMGGQSGSGFEPLPEGAGPSGAVWKGELITQGGGFCGTRTRMLDLDLSSHDGIYMRVKGDGQIFKMNIKTSDQLDVPESTYQATFDTVAGQWADVHIPWHHFVPVKRATSDPQGVPLNPSKIAKLGLVLSRFEFNGMPNPMFTPGPWQLEIDGGISVFKQPRAQIVLVSSAGVERNAIIGDDEEKRKQDIPIVQLNPGGLLNFKYQAEVTARSCGYPYSVIRSTGMIDSNEGGPFLLEADQGDSMSGFMGRDDVADVVLAALSSPEACNKTFELRRAESADSRGRGMSPRAFQRMFLKLSLDRHRWRVGLNPMPKAVPPPPPVTEERKGEILDQVREIQAKEKQAKRETVAASANT